MDTVSDGDTLRLVADPPVQDNPEVWVHLTSGDPIGHLPPEIAQWLWPWMLRGGVAEARAYACEALRYRPGGECCSR